MTTKEKLEQIFGEIKESEWVEYAKVNRLIDELAKEREKSKKLVELLHEIDKSLYIGDDLNDIVILKWYLDVIGTIKDEIKQSLTEYEKL